MLGIQHKLSCAKQLPYPLTVLSLWPQIDLCSGFYLWSTRIKIIYPWKYKLSPKLTHLFILKALINILNILAKETKIPILTCQCCLLN